MISYVQLVPFLNKGIKRIKMYGDKYQIGMVDMLSVAGPINDLSIFDMSKNKKTSNIVRRIGGKAF